MLFAHFVPGYLAAASIEPVPEWNAAQRRFLWAVALSSTVLPDTDVVYNAVLRGFINHSTLWTHSIFVYIGIALIGWLLRYAGKWPYWRTLSGLAAWGGLSHLVLDMIAHNTPLFYPISLHMFGTAPARVVEGGIGAYLTDLIFLFEPLLIALVLVHWWRTHQILKDKKPTEY